MIILEIVIPCMNIYEQYKYEYDIISRYQHPKEGWCLNHEGPKGLLNDTLSHPFGTPWRVQVWSHYMVPPQLLDATTSTSMVYGKNPYHPRFNTRVFDPPRHASFEKYIGKQIQYLLNWQSKISQCSLCKFMQYHLEVYSIFHCWLSECTQKSCLQRGVSIPSQQNSPGKFLLAQAQTLHKHPESCHVGVRPTRLLTWATNGQQPAATKGNVEQKPWHDIPWSPDWFMMGSL